MNMQSLTQDRALTRTEIAAEAVEATDGSVASSAEWLVDWLSKNPEWEAQYIHEIRHQWAKKQVQDVLKQKRHVAIYGNVRNQATKILDKKRDEISPVSPSPLAAAIQDEYERLMDFPLYGTGKRIGDATPAEVRLSAESFSRTGKTLMRKARWQFAVAEAAEANNDNENATIKQSLPGTTLNRLWEESDVA